MRFPKPRQREVRTKTIILTGGLNEVVTDLELKEGELHECLNYMEMDGPYHGYMSIRGYEAYDGKTKPSSISITPLSDLGISDTVVLLLESPGFTDLSSTGNTVTNHGSIADTVFYKFSPSSYKYPLGAYTEVSSVNLGSDWTIDLQLKPASSTSTRILFEKPNCYKLEISPANLLTFSISSTGVSYDYTLADTLHPLTTSLFTHVSIACKGLTIAMALDGVPIVDALSTQITTTVPSINTNTDSLYIGNGFPAGANFNGNIDEFRISSNYLWVHEFTPPIVRYSTAGYSVLNYDDVNREAQRLTIGEVPGEGSILGLHIYQGVLYALRNTGDTPATAALYKAVTTLDINGNIVDSSSGWVLVDDTFNPDGSLEARNWRFQSYNSGQEVMLMCDGVSIPRVWNGTTMTVLIATGTAPVDDASSIPDLQASPRYAKKLHIFDDRWMLGYDDDDIVLSSKTTPLDFSQGFAAQVIIGDAITNFQELPGETMAIICRNSVKILEKLTSANTTAATPDYTFIAKSFSREAGGIANTSERMLGSVIYADDRGVLSLSASDKYGDFSAAAINKKVNRTYLSKKSLITTSLIDKQFNQYRIYFSDGTGLIFSFLGEELKGSTLVEYDTPVMKATHGEDSSGDIWKFFSSDGDSGFVYQMDIGTSFNGAAIPTGLKTSYYHYGSPRYWKQFQRMIFEITAVSGTIFNIRNVFDYNDAEFPSTLWSKPNVKGVGGIWDKDYWSGFVWSGSVVQRFINYIRGYGTNMSIEIATESKYVDQHILHNVIVDYQQQNIQQ